MKISEYAAQVAKNMVFELNEKYKLCFYKGLSKDYKPISTDIDLATSKENMKLIEEFLVKNNSNQYKYAITDYGCVSQIHFCIYDKNILMDRYQLDIYHRVWWKGICLLDFELDSFEDGRWVSNELIIFNFIVQNYKNMKPWKINIINDFRNSNKREEVLSSLPKIRRKIIQYYLENNKISYTLLILFWFSSLLHRGPLSLRFFTLKIKDLIYAYRCRRENEKIFTNV